MVAPVLNDYEYQFKDAGVGTLLNGNSVLPFWDVTQVAGLMDFPELDSKVHDLDGRHGSFIGTRFFGHRTIVVDGVLYANTSTIDSTIETLRTSILPDSLDYPFYFKHPGLLQKYVIAKCTNFKCDVTTARRIGSGAFQLQFMAGDPRHYLDAATVPWTTNVNFNLNNTGNAPLGPSIAITANATTTANLTILNNGTSEGVTLSFAVTNGDAIVVNLDELSVKKNNVYTPVLFTVTATTWPVTTPGLVESWKVTSNIGNGTATNKSTWL